MNPPIMRVYVVLLVLLGALVGFTTYWTVFDDTTLSQRIDNRRSLIETAGVRRGTIGSVDGQVLAKSVPQGSGAQTIYTRTYPTGSLFGHPVGYSFIQLGSSGVEESENDVLIGKKNEFSMLLDQIQGT